VESSTPRDAVAMVLREPGRPLVATRIQTARPGPGEVSIRVRACAVCRTDLHVVDGELAAKGAVVPGHQVVGDVEEIGPEIGPATSGIAVGERVGVGWLASTCGACRFCTQGRENLCEAARFTGCTVDGGFSERMVARAAYCFPIPRSLDVVAAAPLLCAGAIGYRAYRFIPPHAERVGIYGFGAAAHLIAQIARHDGRELFAFTRPGDDDAQRFARGLGILAPVGALVPAALSAVDKGGVVVCGGIHMSDIPAFPYRLLWEERTLRSVANLTRDDGTMLLRLAAEIPLRPSTTTYALTDANRALADLRSGGFTGSAVLVP
jgi:propanol-preferring alcohol dehydrogenase